MKPIGSRVLIRPHEKQKQTEGGIIIPESVGETPHLGDVIAVGELVTEVAVGDVVLFSRYGGADVEYEGEKYRIFDIRDIFAVV